MSGLVSYLYDANGNLLSERTKKEEREYRYDLLNRQTCVHIKDPQENVENSYLYDAFGNVLESREIIQNRMLYTGQQYDQATGQNYLRARYYNPVMGRFTQEDTYRGDGLNLYAYCANNPVVYYDPSGHQPVTNACGKGSTEEPKKDPAQVVSEGVEGGNTSIKNWKGEEVKIPEGHAMSPRDPAFSAKPITEAGPYTSVQRDEFLSGNSAGTKIAPHHRHQIPVSDGGVIDELPDPGHLSGNQHTAGSPNRHPAKSIFNSKPGGNALRTEEIRNHWIEKGKRLVEVAEGTWIDPGF